MSRPKCPICPYGVEHSRVLGMFRSFSTYALIIALALAVLGGAALAAPNQNDIIWYTPVTADDDAAVVYEDSIALAPSSVPAQTCAVTDSPFMLAWLAAAPHTASRQRPRVVIVIDDMGIDKKRSARMARLSSQLTLAFLPYAHNVQLQVNTAAAMGHEIMMHVPMLPQGAKIDPGPNVLRADIAADELRRRILANLDAFEGYVGINNHMGSAFTQDRAGLEMLMSELATRGVFFLDSKTHPKSVAEQVATEAGVMAAHRDVFIDHIETPQAVAKALARVEHDARKNGVAIAIGHPKDVTIEGLAAWLPTLKAKGIEVVKLGDVLKERRKDVLQAVRQTPANAITTEIITTP